MGDLKKAQQLRARREMVRQKQQAAIEKRDIRQNAIRSENIQRKKKAAEKVGKTFSYASTVTPTVEGGPLNYGSPVKKSSCIKMYDSKGKQTGLMMEGSVAHMESMANYGSPNKKVDPKPFQDPGAPEGFKADAPEVIGISTTLSDRPGGNIVDLGEGESVSGQDMYKVRKLEHARQGFGSQLTEEDKRNVAQKRLTSKKLSATDVARGLNLSPRITKIKIGA